MGAGTAAWEAREGVRGVCEMKEYPFVDITAPELGVEIDVRHDGKVIWVAVDGVTVLRICQIPAVSLTDRRRV